MKTRTLLLLSVATGLMILLAGGAFLVRLSRDPAPVPAAAVGDEVVIGDLHVTVTRASTIGDRYVVEVELGGVDDLDGADSFRLVTGDRQLAPLAPAAGGSIELPLCGAVTPEPGVCTLEFDVSAVESSSRVLVARRGESQRTWTLED